MDISWRKASSGVCEYVARWCHGATTSNVPVNCWPRCAGKGHHLRPDAAVDKAHDDAAHDDAAHDDAAQDVVIAEIARLAASIKDRDQFPACTLGLLATSAPVLAAPFVDGLGTAFSPTASTPLLVSSRAAMGASDACDNCERVINSA